MSVTVKHEGPVSTITLAIPPMNLMNIEVMDALVEAHREADAHSETRVIVTDSGVPRMFSNGLDPQYVLEKTPEDRVDIFRAVGRMLHGLFSLSKPHICRVTGPAMAGGAILAITADFRYFEAEHGRISFAEPKVGLPIPEAIVQVIRHFCNPSYLRQVVMFAMNMDAQQARTVGIADGVATGDAFEEMVQKQVERLARLSPSVLKETKRALRQETFPYTEAFQERDTSISTFVGDDFLGEGLHALIEDRFPNFKA